MMRRRVLAAVIGGGLALAMAVATAQAADPRVGVYSGHWEGKLPTTLTINAILPDGTVQGVYAWGDMPDWKVTAGSANFAKPKLDPKTNTFGFGATIAPGQTVRQEFTFNADGTVSGLRLMNGARAGTAHLKKVDKEAALK